MLNIPAITSGAIDVVPVFSSTLSMMKMAMIDVKATVIWVIKDCKFKSNNSL